MSRQILATSVVLCGALLASCSDCEPLKFNNGEFVKNRVIPSLGVGVVTRVARGKNYEGVCLADVRWPNGSLLSMSIDELEPAHD